MSARRGWCPSLHEPMPTGDGLLVRVKPRGGRLSARAVRVLAGAAISSGNGMIDLTRRGAVQARGLSPATAPLFAAAMIAAGLASPGVGADRRRNVIATPLAGADPGVHRATHAIVASIETALEEATDLDLLPAKFGVAVDGGGVLPFGDVGADIAVRLRAETAELALAGGALVAPVPIAAAAAAVLSLVHAFLVLDGAGLRRMRALVAERGEAAVFAACGLTPIAAMAQMPIRPAVGVHAYAGGIAFGAGLPFGSAAASDWVGLAELAVRFGDGAVRLTPWRTLLIAGVEDPVSLRNAIGDGFITDPDDGRLRTEACPGEPACASASVLTRALATRLRPSPGTTLHVSGCDKGCAHPGPSAITLVGRAGGYDLVRHGRASDAPERFALSEAEIMAL